jgi:hypothetical protein
LQLFLLLTKESELKMSQSALRTFGEFRSSRQASYASSNTSSMPLLTSIPEDGSNEATSPITSIGPWAFVEDDEVVSCPEYEKKRVPRYSNEHKASPSPPDFDDCFKFFGERSTNLPHGPIPDPILHQPTPRSSLFVSPDSVYQHPFNGMSPSPPPLPFTINDGGRDRVYQARVLDHKITNDAHSEVRSYMSALVYAQVESSFAPAGQDHYMLDPNLEGVATRYIRLFDVNAQDMEEEVLGKSPIGRLKTVSCVQL